MGGNAEVTIKKRQIRKEVLSIRDSIPKEERDKASQLLTLRMMQHPWFIHCDKLLCFVSYGSEIDTTMLMEEALRLGKQVFVPKVIEDRMEFYRILSLDDLEQGKGTGVIREPVKGCRMYVYDPEEDDTLVIMPGVAFDRVGRRIGYGKGFYDRFLMGKEVLRQHTIAVGFACQMLGEIPEEKQDVRSCQVMVV